MDLRTYDQIQREAKLVQCSQCQCWYYATKPKTPELCVTCRPNPWAVRCQEQDK